MLIEAGLGAPTATQPWTASSAWLRGALARILPNHGIVMPIAGGPLFGRLLCADFSRRPQYLFGTYERAMVRAIRDNLFPGQVAYDVGANIGYMALVMSQRVGPSGHVIAFEPSPRAQRLLSANATRNPGLRFEAFQLALADRTGHEVFSDFSYDLVSRLGDHAAEYPDAELVTVPVETLDHLLSAGRLPKPDFVKLDVEGAEGRVVRGMLGIVRDCRPLILAELHEADAAGETTELLLAEGYTSSVVSSSAPRQVLFKPAGR